jgi:hypothetical protein
MAISNITFEAGTAADNPSPIEEQYIDEKDYIQYRVWQEFLSTAPTTDSTLVPSSYNGAPLRRLRSQGRGRDGIEAVFSAYYDTKGTPDPYGTALVEEIIPQQMWISNPWGKLYWPNGKRLRQDEFGQEYPLLGWAYRATYTNLLSAPSISSSSVGGCIAAGLNTMYGACGPETLLFGTPKLTAAAKVGSGKRYGAVYSYAFNPNGWNKWWNVRAAAWQSLYLDKVAGTRYIYYKLI